MIDKLIYGFAAFCIAFVLGVWFGIRHEEGVEAKRQASALTAVIVRSNKQTAADNKDSIARTAATDKLDTKTSTLQQKVRYETITNTVYRDCRITDNSLHDLTSLVDAANSAGRLDKTVPTGTSTR